MIADRECVQLNMYSFSKTRHDANWREFKQEMFQRGKRHLLHLIKRKTGAAQITPKAASKCQAEIPAAQQPTLTKSHEFAELEKELQATKRRVGVILCVIIAAVVAHPFGRPWKPMFGC